MWTSKETGHHRAKAPTPGMKKDHQKTGSPELKTQPSKTSFNNLATPYPGFQLLLVDARFQSCFVGQQTNLGPAPSFQGLQISLQKRGAGGANQSEQDRQDSPGMLPSDSLQTRFNFTTIEKMR
jgi:hypothetical protein